MIRFFIIALFAISCIRSFSQILVGPSIGGNLSWVRFENAEDRDLYKGLPKPGFEAGFLVSFHVNKKFFLHTQFLYSTKGFDLSSDVDRKFHHVGRLNYIDIPIVYTAEFKTTFKGNREFKWYFGLGPNISYWINGKGSFLNSNLSEAGQGNQELDYRIVFDKAPTELDFDQFSVTDPNRIQLGLNLGMGVVFEPHAAGKFMLLARYEIGHSYLARGFLYTADSPSSGSSLYTARMNVRNQGFRVSISYLYDLKVSERNKGKSTIKKKRL